MTAAVSSPISKTRFFFVSLAACVASAATWHFLGRELAWPLTFFPGLGMTMYVNQKKQTTPDLTTGWQIIFAIGIGLLLGAAYGQLAYVVLKYHWL